MKHNLMCRRSIRRIAVSAAAASLLGMVAGCASPSSAQKVSLVGWDGSTLVSADGRTITVGGFPGPCFGTVRLVARETKSQVGIWLRYVVPANHGVCDATVVLIRSLRVRLSEPLGHRALVDGATREPLAFFDGGRLLRPTAVPAGYTLSATWPLTGILSAKVPGVTQIFRSSGSEIDIRQSAGHLALPQAGHSVAIRVRGHAGQASGHAISWREHGLSMLIEAIGPASQALGSQALIALANSAP